MITSSRALSFLVLTAPYRLLLTLPLFLRFICSLRSGVYRLVADNRYKILGKDEDGATPSCKLRADSLTAAERFLE